MSAQFSILIGNRSRFEAGDASGYWLDLPATKGAASRSHAERRHYRRQSAGFSIRGYSDDPDNHIALPYEMVCAADVDELNF